MPVTSRDRGYDGLIRRAVGLKPVAIATGILAKDGAAPKQGANALSLIQVALWNHFGVPSSKGGWRIPPRPFITDWFDAEEPHLRTKLTALLKLVVAGSLTREQALEQLGAYCVGQIQARISARMYEPNARSTERRKGSSTPLVDKGQLRASVSFEVREGSARSA